MKLNPEYFIFRDDGTIEQTASVLEWAEWFETKKNRVILQVSVKRGSRKKFVSTVFLGVDHSFGFGVAPLIFETMIFEAGAAGDYQERYSTLNEAIVGHSRAVDEARRSL